MSGSVAAALRFIARVMLIARVMKLVNLFVFIGIRRRNVAVKRNRLFRLKSVRKRIAMAGPLITSDSSSNNMRIPRLATLIGYNYRRNKLYTAR